MQSIMEVGINILMLWFVGFFSFLILTLGLVFIWRLLIFFFVGWVLGRLMN